MLTLAGAATLSHDLWVNVVRRGVSSDREELKVARAATIVLGVLIWRAFLRAGGPRAAALAAGGSLATALAGLAAMALALRAPPDAQAQAEPRFRALLFSKTAAFRHDSIPAGIDAIQKTVRRRAAVSAISAIGRPTTAPPTKAITDRRIVKRAASTR